MPFTPEQKREYRAIEKARKSFVPQMFDILAGRDALAGKNRYKSETQPLLILGKIWTGLMEVSEEEDKRTSAKAKRKKKQINPSATEILGITKKSYDTLEELVAGFEQWLELRDRARKDLYWLCKTVLKKDLEPDVHQVICDQFVKKNFDGAFPEGYTIGDVHEAIGRQERFDQDGRPTKELLLLDSRSFFKSTIDGIDAIQWMLNVPDIRILLLTGEYKLGVGFLKEIKGYLYLAEGAEPTDLHFLFPEYIVKGVDGTSKEPLTLSVRKHTQVSATLWVNSIDSNLSGWHCDIKKGDDVITDANSNSEDVRISLKEKYDGTENIRDDWGFSDSIGTRYFPNDWYGTRLQAYRDNPEENALKYFCRGCWTVKPEFVEVPLKELTADMVVLTFPQKRTFKYLRGRLLNNEREFRCQQLNEPAGLDRDDGEMVSFTEDALRARIINMKDVPPSGEVFICWDWALTANKNSDYSAGVCGRIYPEKDRWMIAILDIVYGKWIPSELALQIVLFNKKWNPKSTLIEASLGSNLLWDAIRTRAVQYGVTIDAPVWKPPSTQPNAKRSRIIGLETLLDEQRLSFVAGPWLDEMIHQFTGYTGRKKNSGRKDDIPDAMSYLSFFLPNSPLSKMKEETDAIERIQKDKRMRNQMYDRVFGSPMNPLPSVNEPPAQQEWRPRWPTRQ